MACFLPLIKCVYTKMKDVNPNFWLRVMVKTL